MEAPAFTGASLVETKQDMTTQDDPDTVARGLAYGATGREEVAQETLPLGAALSTMNAAEAALFAVACEGYRRMKEGTK